MTEEVKTKAHRSSSAVLKALQEPGRAAAIAASMGVSETTISRMKNDQLESFCLFLAFAGLKVVPADSRCFPPDYVDALLLMAKQHLNEVQSVRHLDWD